jgi:hypothetical protein
MFHGFGMDEWLFKDLNKEKDIPHICTVYTAAEFVAFCEAMKQAE